MTLEQLQHLLDRLPAGWTASVLIQPRTRRRVNGFATLEVTPPRLFSPEDFNRRRCFAIGTAGDMESAARAALDWEECRQIEWDEQEATFVADDVPF